MPKSEVPPEGKTCYGLTDGPYASYQHISRIPLELGHEKSRADPCLFFLRGQGGKEVNGTIGLATDDMIHGGDRNHWSRMGWLKKNYQMGKYTTSSPARTLSRTRTAASLLTKALHREPHPEDRGQPSEIGPEVLTMHRGGDSSTSWTDWWTQLGRKRKGPT